MTISRVVSTSPAVPAPVVTFASETGAAAASGAVAETGAVDTFVSSNRLTAPVLPVPETASELSNTNTAPEGPTGAAVEAFKSCLFLALMTSFWTATPLDSIDKALGTNNAAKLTGAVALSLITVPLGVTLGVVTGVAAFVDTAIRGRS